MKEEGKRMKVNKCRFAERPDLRAFILQPSTFNLSLP
jgi:hypothetical protein